MKVLVTGGSRGIGNAVVDIFLSYGADVAFCSKDEQNVNHALQSFKDKYPNCSIIGKAVNVTDPEAVQDFVDQVCQNWSTIDVLVNNAGTYLPGNISEQNFSTLQQQLETNLYSAFHMTHAVLPKMIASKNGHIFNVCSIASLQAYPGGGAYSVSKYALLGLNDNLREEMKQLGIKVTAVIPGATYSDSWSGSGVEASRIMDAYDIAKSIYHATQLSPQAVIERLVIRPQLGDL